MKRWYVGAAGTAVLLAAVVLVRPGSQVPAGAVGPDQPGSRVAAERPEAANLGPDRLAGATINSVAVTSTGVGPLQLGLTQGELAGAGWTFRYGPGACLRLAPTRVGDVVLSGWLVDEQLVAAQVEMSDVQGQTSPTSVGFTFGRPVAEAEGFAQQVLTAGAAGPGGGTEVGIGTRVHDGAALLVSDLGTYGVRFVEVRVPGAVDCTVSADLLGDLETPTAGALAGDSVRRLPAGTVGPVIDQVGTSLEQLQAVGSSHAAQAVVPTACDGLQLLAGPNTDFFLRDGTVVGQRYVATRGQPPSAEWVDSQTTLFGDEAGVLVARPVGFFVRPGQGDAAGRESVTGSDSVAGYYVYTAEVLPQLDTAVLVEGPTALEEHRGEICRA